MSKPTSGQIALGFVIVMVAGLVFVMAILNLGQMAQVRVETSNAADAGALAGASWIASGENEAALIAGRMLDSVAMVQAIYLVPFCPGAGQRFYAEMLWMSLDVDPVNPVPAGRTVRPGPVGYFKEVAEDALYAAWYVGAREMLSASLNNMMMKFNTGPTGACGRYPDGSLHCEPVGVSQFGSLTDNIKEEQLEQLVSHSGGANLVLATLDWNNAMPASDPENLTHHPKYALRYTDEPPTLNIPNWPYGTYYQYYDAADRTMPIFPAPLFDCEFEGWGIRKSIADSNVPLAEIPDDLADFSQNPLEMVRRGGVWQKRWDEALPGMVPSITQLNPGTCQTPAGAPQRVCGMRLITPTPRPLVAVGFNNGNPQVRVTVSHEVQTATGTQGFLGSYSPVPDLVQRFDAVASQATAEVSPASTFPSDPRARAQLIQAD